MALARLEGRIAIGRFLQRFPNFAANGIAQRNRRVAVSRVWFATGDAGLVLDTGSQS